MADGPTRPKNRAPLVGIGLMLAGMMLMPVMDGTAKYLAARYPVAEVIWARYFFHLIVMVPVILWRYGPRACWPNKPLLQLVRGGLMLGSSFFFVFAIRHMPLADALTLVFVAPLVVTALSPFLLGERVDGKRWLAVAVGFSGAVIIIRPGFGIMQSSAFLALGAGCTYAFYLIATRKLAGSAPPLVTLTYTALLGGVILAAFMPAVWVAPGLADLGRMVLMGLVSAGGHLLLIMAFDRAPASVLAPFFYSQIVMATVFGFFVFGDFPDGLTWLGIAVIVSSGVYLSLREGASD